MKFSRPLLAFILGQIGLHACMTGVRMSAPLQALRQQLGSGSVGLLMALFAVGPVLLALPAGRMADRYGYHRPLYFSVGLSAMGALAAALSSHYLAMCAAAVLTGAGTNFGLITIQRTAGRTAADSTERLQVFSWLGLAPALANFLGPVTAGAVIDLAGFRAAFAVLMLMPLASLLFSRFVPREEPVRSAESRTSGTSWNLLRSPELRRLLLVNWLISTSWDVHTFVLPILGHDRGLSASAIGGVLGVFAVAVASVRLIIPFIAHRVTEAQVIAAAMVSVAIVFAVYPLMHSAWLMAVCSALLGCALGTVQPMVMSMLHHITPEHRHGEAIAFRSMTIKMSGTVMPLVFGLVGTALGSASLFWFMGAAVGAGSLQARRMPPPPDH